MPDAVACSVTPRSTLSARNNFLPASWSKKKKSVPVTASKSKKKEPPFSEEYLTIHGMPFLWAIDGISWRMYVCRSGTVLFGSAGLGRSSQPMGKIVVGCRYSKTTIPIQTTGRRRLFSNLPTIVFTEVYSNHRTVTTSSDKLNGNSF